MIQQRNIVHFKRCTSFCLLDFVVVSDSLLFAGYMAGSVRFWLYMEEQEVSGAMLSAENTENVVVGS